MTSCSKMSGSPCSLLRPILFSHGPRSSHPSDDCQPCLLIFIWNYIRWKFLPPHLIGKDTRISTWILQTYLMVLDGRLLFADRELPFLDWNRHLEGELPENTESSEPWFRFWYWRSLLPGIKHKGKHLNWGTVCVNYCVVGGNGISTVERIKPELTKPFEMEDLGEVQASFGLKIESSRKFL